MGGGSHGLVFLEFARGLGYHIAHHPFFGAIDERICTRVDTADREQTCGIPWSCLLYTSDAADDLLCVDLGGRRNIKKNISRVHRLPLQLDN